MRKARAWLKEAGYVAVIIALLPMLPVLPMVARMIEGERDTEAEALALDADVARLNASRRHATRCIEHSSTMCDRSLCKYECIPGDGCHEFPYICTQEESCA